MEQQEQNQNISPLFLKGFNQGYYIQSSNPELAEKMLTAENEPNEYWHGFESGAKEYEIEISQGKDVSPPSKDQGMDMER
ncbi:hypothetical protein [Aquimarina macrocephali]|uniref:hypothetical protein n=1 Tax=Aquimarina macrocephali TaxID=666563 RepID=UPI000467B732|nr:hypothetical protein [Aquimarina macrocephali]